MTKKTIHTFISDFYEQYKDHVSLYSDKENFELRLADEWASQGESPEEIEKRQELLLSHGPSFIYDEYIQAAGGPTFDDYMSSPSSFENLHDNPVFDLSSPFNAAYGTGTSAYEMATGTDLSNNSNWIWQTHLLIDRIIKIYKQRSLACY